MYYIYYRIGLEVHAVSWDLDYSMYLQKNPAKVKNYILIQFDIK